MDRLLHRAHVWLLLVTSVLSSGTYAVARDDQEAARPDAQPQAALSRAQQLSSRSLLREAAALLRSEMNRGVDELYADFAVELADIYSQSGLHRDAAEWASRASTRMANEPSLRANNGLKTLAALIEIRSLMALGDFAEVDQKLASLLQLVAKLPDDPIRTLTIQSLHAESYVYRGDLDLNEAWRQVLPSATVLRNQLRDSDASNALVDQTKPGDESGLANDSSWRIRASRALIDSLSLFGRHAEATEQLLGLLSRYEGQEDASTRVDLLSRLAQERFLAGDIAGQSAALQQASRLARERLTQEAPQSLEQIDLLLTASDLLRRTAQVAETGKRTTTLALIREAEQYAQRAIDASSAMQDQQPQESSARLLLARKRQLEAAQARHDLGARFKQGELRAHLSQLLDSLTDAVLPNDPRLALVRSALGAEYLATGEYERAEALLSEARLSLQPAGRSADLARNSLLLVEVKLAQGRLQDAQVLLGEARQAFAEWQSRQQRRRDASRKSLVDQAGVVVVGDVERDYTGAVKSNPVTLAPWIERNAGRIAAAKGRYTTALARFDAAERLCFAIGHHTTAERAATLIQRGGVYRILARFVEAQQCCQEAIELQLQTLGPTDRRLLPYRLALAGVAAAHRDTTTLRREVDAARLIVAQDANARVPATLLHLDALGHFLASSKSTDESLDESHLAESERLWRAALEIQTREGLLLDQARSRHYLSKVALRDAAARNRRASIQAGSAYESRLRALEQRQQEHQQRCAALEKRQNEYRDQLAAYNQLGQSEQESAYPRLMDLRDELSDLAHSLTRTGVEITNEHEALESLAVSGRHREADLVVVERLAEAERQARSACIILSELAVYPRLHYAALCNHAEVLRAQSGGDPSLKAAATEKLSEAVALVEEPRLGVGDQAAQSEFFARHGDVFDLLVHWHVEDGRPRRALAYADLSRNRTFLDQIRCSQYVGADEDQPRPGDQASAERAYAELVVRLRELASRDASTLTAAEQDERRIALNRIQQHRINIDTKQAEAETEATGGLLAGALSRDAVDQTIARLESSRTPTLCYHVGTRYSYVFLIGFSDTQVQAIPLKSRAVDAAATLAPAGRETIDRLVHEYLDVYRSRNNSRMLMRGGRIAERLAAATDVFLPIEVREQLQSLKSKSAKCVCFAPDGPLFQLPLPALVTSATPTPQFLIDQAPPLVVAPSLMVREALRRPLSERREDAEATVRLLSVARPKYFSPEQVASAELVSAAARYQSLGGPLADLAFTQTESDDVCSRFPVGQWRQLIGSSATESALRDELRRLQPQVLHLATHGIASNNSGAIEGALALAAPRSGSSDLSTDDGFLELSEIVDLHLTNCSLAVLSACQTNLGRDRPLEMGASFARAFLAAGARRVAATHWQMDDKSGARFVQAFFASMTDVADGNGANTPVDYPLAMHNARLAVRSVAEWDTPYHWAVFTLIGPGS